MYLLPTVNIGVVLISVTSVSLSVSACLVSSLTFENLGLESSFLVHSYILRISRYNSCIKVIGSRSGSHRGIKYSIETSL